MDATVDGRVPPDEPTAIRTNSGTIGNSQPQQQQHNQNCPHVPQQELHQHHQPHQQQQQWNLMDNAHPSLPGAIQRKSRTNDRSKERTGQAELPTGPMELDTGHYGDDGGGPKGGKASSDKLVVHLIIGFRDICVFTLVLPLGTLFVCFVSAYVFQPEEIHETHCRV
uniref:Uncharacterized protein n=1 Tax=Anopheles culicifacies TaxID=139723 RepID=A0A182M247_9DIPT